MGFWSDPTKSKFIWQLIVGLSAQNYRTLRFKEELEQGRMDLNNQSEKSKFGEI